MKPLLVCSAKPTKTATHVELLCYLLEYHSDVLSGRGIELDLDDFGLFENNFLSVDVDEWTWADELEKLVPVEENLVEIGHSTPPSFSSEIKAISIHILTVQPLPAVRRTM